jgi:hypothetical protein
MNEDFGPYAVRYRTIQILFVFMLQQNLLGQSQSPWTSDQPDVENST